uniref:Putative PAP-specific phosphatase, mitochondrial n=1 Tax=Aegilops tauschii TaxID=37682 RepID=R7W4R8_AEGTA
MPTRGSFDKTMRLPVCEGPSLETEIMSRTRINLQDYLEKSQKLKVRASMLVGDEKILEKNDQTHVTIADFGVQALISFEEDSAFIRSSNAADSKSNTLVESISSFFTKHVNNNGPPLTHDDVLRAIDRGGKDAVSFDSNPATYWLLDPIDGTKGFLKGEDSLYVAWGSGEVLPTCAKWSWVRCGLSALHHAGVRLTSYNPSPDPPGVGASSTGSVLSFICIDTICVVCSNTLVGLALVVDGKLAVGVMGCPNLTDTTVGDTEDESIAACPGHGILMVSHVGCGTWTRPMSADQLTTAPDIWKRCSVDPCSVAHMARFCIVDSHTWDMMPLSAHFSSTMDESEPRDENKILLQNSCGGSLSKYLLVACGRMSVFILLARAEKLLKAWDHAVGVICVEEAGGQTCDWSGKPLDFGADLTGRRIIYPSGGVLATNGALHDKLVEMVSANYK